ncbi:MAG: hypothetical protein ABIM58_04010 [candidate division WOR-3 bacterium]
MAGLKVKCNLCGNTFVPDYENRVCLKCPYNIFKNSCKFARCPYCFYENFIFSDVKIENFLSKILGKLKWK